MSDDGMIHWFGLVSWDAPVCHDCPRDPIPVGAECLRCKLPIGTRDSGVSMLYMAEETTRAVYHFDCHLKSIIPHKDWFRYGLIPKQSDGGIFNEALQTWLCPTCKACYSFKDRHWI